MEREIVNPWTWQERAGFVHANVVTGAQRTVFCAGQISVDDDGVPVHEGDMRGQIERALDNLETVLGQSGCALSDVVRLTYYTTDVPAFRAAMAEVAPRLGSAGCRPTATLLGIVRLAQPELLVEIEATAVTG